MLFCLYLLGILPHGNIRSSSVLFPENFIVHNNLKNQDFLRLFLPFRFRFFLVIMRLQAPACFFLVFLLLGMFFLRLIFWLGSGLLRLLFTIFLQFCEFIADFFLVKKVLKNFWHLIGLAAVRHFSSRQDSKFSFSSSLHCHLVNFKRVLILLWKVCK